AEDGIRDRNVTGVQTCALPISLNDVEDLTNALIRFENGASIFVDVSFTLQAKQDETSVKLFGDKGGAEVEPAFSLVTEKNNTILNSTPQVDNLGFDFEKSFANEIDHFVECCLENKETIAPIADGVEVMKMLNAVYESAKQGKEVYL